MKVSAPKILTLLLLLPLASALAAAMAVILSDDSEKERLLQALTGGFGVAPEDSDE